MKKALCLFLSIFLLVACNNKNGSKFPTYKPIEVAVKDFSILTQRLEETILALGGTRLYQEANYRSFYIEFDEAYAYLEIDFFEKTLHFELSLNFEKNHSLPIGLDINTIVDIYNIFSVDKIDVSLLKDFFVAPDSKYLPYDYDEIMGDDIYNYFYETVISYKSIGEYYDDFYIDLMVYEDLDGHLTMFSYLTEGLDMNKTTQAVIDIVDKAPTVCNWHFWIYEAYTARLSVYTKVEINISSPYLYELLMDPYELELEICFESRLASAKDEKKYLDVTTFLAIVEVLAPGKLTEKQLREFLDNDKDYNLNYFEPEEMIRAKQKDLNADDYYYMGLTFYLDSEFWESLRFDFRPYSYD